MTDEELQRTNPVIALLRTLLPWVNLEPGADDAPRAPPEIPQPLWGPALNLFPPLAQHLSEQGMHADAADLSAEEQHRIGQAIATFLLANQ
jgi:hypothetical protein